MDLGMKDRKCTMSGQFEINFKRRELWMEYGEWTASEWSNEQSKRKRVMDERKCRD